jgi:hypothetical protein
MVVTGLPHISNIEVTEVKTVYNMNPLNQATAQETRHKSDFSLKSTMFLTWGCH